MKNFSSPPDYLKYGLNKHYHDFGFDVEPDSLLCSTIHSGGRNTTVTKNLTGAGAQVVNLFQYTGVIRVIGIHMIATAVTDSTTFTLVKFVSYDGTVSVDITNTVNGSGCVAGGLFIKEDIAGNALLFANADQTRVVEAASAIVSIPPLLVQKSATDTFVRLSFTGDGSTDIDVFACLRWSPMSTLCSVIAV